MMRHGNSGGEWRAAQDVRHFFVSSTQFFASFVAFSLAPRGGPTHGREPGRTREGAAKPACAPEGKRIVSFPRRSPFKETS